MRLIDANAIVEVANRAYDAWNLAMATQDTNRGVNKVLRRQELCKCVKAVADNAPTIDPEQLPIVRELRDKNLKTECRADALMAKILVLEENLKQVTAERDAAVRDLYIAKDCNTCALRFTDNCLLEECMDPCNSFAYGNVPYKWRGLEGA